MSYQVLARKWRPRRFDTLVGQEHVVRALAHALETGRLHHAYLFTGTRGVGKTTISRILAKALNCETGPTPQPCGECPACLAIDADRFPDYVEMDAASNRGVDDMAALLEQAVYAPSQGRCKVYMIDEVHMLTGHAFNAMLKTLEEPPDHVKFILATTDPQKIPVTVLSRCLQFNLKSMPLPGMLTHLAAILQAEGVPFAPEALPPLAKAAQGSMRDALSLLDQAIAHGGGQLTEAGVTDMLGTVGEAFLFDIVDAVLAGDAQRLVACAEQMEGRSLDFSRALQSLAALLVRVASAQLAPATLEALPDAQRIGAIAQRMDPEFVQLAYQIVIHGRKELPLAPDEASGFMMTLLRLQAFSPETPPPLRTRGEEGPAPDRRPVAPVLASAAAPPPVSMVSDGPAGLHTEAPKPTGMPKPTALKPPPPEPLPQKTPSEPPSCVVPLHAAVPPEIGGGARIVPLPRPLAAVRPHAEEPVFSPHPRKGTLHVLTTVDASAHETRSPVPLSAPVHSLSEPEPPPLALADSPVPPVPDQAWEVRVQAMHLGGLVLELAQNCVWVEQKGALVRLQLDIRHKHLLSVMATRHKLQAELSRHLGINGLKLEIFTAPLAESESTPAHLEAERRRKAQEKALLDFEADPLVGRLITLFDARIDRDSVRPLS